MVSSLPYLNNIILGSKAFPGSNTLAYLYVASVTKEKRFHNFGTRAHKEEEELLVKEDLLVVPACLASGVILVLQDWMVHL